MLGQAESGDLVGNVGQGGPITVLHGMVEGQDARVLADLAPMHPMVVHVVADDVRMHTMAQLLAFFAPGVRVLTLPAWDCLPYDRVSPSADVTATRIATLAELHYGVEQGSVILLTTAAAVMQRVIPPAFLATHSLHLERGGVLTERTLEKFLIGGGYARTDTVRDHGEFAVRGGIIDVFPASFDKPIRLDLFGDTIESIKTFDPLTQRSEGDVDTVHILPATEYALDDASIAHFRAGYRDLFGVPHGDDALYAAVTEGRRHAGAEHWLPLFHDDMATVFDYVPVGAAVVFDPQSDHTMDERWAQVRDYYASRQAFLDARPKNDKSVPYLPLPADRLYLKRDNVRVASAAFETIQFESFHLPSPSPFKGEGRMGDNEEFTPTRPDSQVDLLPQGGGKSVVRARDFADVRAQPKADVFQAVVEYLTPLRVEPRKILLACYSIGARDRMKALLENAGLERVVMVETYHQATTLWPTQTGLIVLPLEHGFVAPDLAIITEQDILGDRLVRGRGKRRKADAFINDITALNPGDLVVHVDHGVGRFDGLETITAAGTRHDCLKLIYDGGDRLFLPVENMELLSRFGGESDTTALDKLGGAGWQARKARVKKDLMSMAEGLLAIAAERQLRGAEEYVADPQGYNEFVARFPYQETDDQLNAIQDVTDDLARGTPADRLVCGDVGFGKTEVALRAAYIAASSGVQVAVVVPTTLLARQHFANFQRRFAGFGFRVGQLSRLVSPTDRKLVKQGLTDGSVNIVIGTHALLAKDIKFAHLGLMVVDEEQRFGVKQKEALKALKANVHVVTLTATPIPRTLQMALTGVREMSIIASAPVDRLAIRTHVMPFDPMIVREAILRERHRGGQTFYVCPRIADLADVAEKLRDLVPEVRVVMAHGQLSPTDLEDRMSAFYDGQYDVLLATNIIESGIDIPSANTMIVHRADMFGLAQLYQIRGRIGRSKARAYAYLTYDPSMKLNATAQKRLEVIEMLDTLGSGFQLASHDLDIRGAGNLLGDDQSGHIREVGVELYQHMLEDAVATARGRTAQNGHPCIGGGPDHKEFWTPIINLGTSILIPEDYITDLTVRLSLYRRLADLETRPEIEGFAAEMIDRFGPLPPEVENLLDVIELKGLCRAAGVDKVDAGPKGVVIGFHNNRPPAPDALFKWLTDKKGTVKLRPDQKIAAAREWADLSHRVRGVRGILTELAGLEA
jgi:transcription-repair coupling factor (superfamily II helicase)